MALYSYKSINFATFSRTIDKRLLLHGQFYLSIYFMNYYMYAMSIMCAFVNILNGNLNFIGFEFRYKTPAGTRSYTKTGTMASTCNAKKRESVFFLHMKNEHAVKVLMHANDEK